MYVCVSVKNFRPPPQQFPNQWTHSYEMLTIYHRCAAGGSMRACHAAGSGWIPSQDKLPGWVFSRFFLTSKTNVQESLDQSGPGISFDHHNHPSHIRLVRMNVWVNDVYRL